MSQPCWIETKGVDLPRFHLEVVADGVLRSRLLADIDDRVGDGHAGLARSAEVVEIVGNVVKLLGADDQVDVRQPLQELGAAILRHAAEDPENEIGLIPLARLDVPGLADGLLLGGIADAAGVQQQDIAGVFRGDDPIPAGAQHRRDGFAVALVHLAPVGFDEDSVQREEGCK